MRRLEGWARNGDIARWGGPAAVAGGLLWLLVWLHSLSAHGPTELNRKDVVLGLTWMDSAKALVACFLLFTLAAFAFFARVERPGARARAAIALTALALALLALGTALQFWTFPWGSYADEAARFESGLPRSGGIVQAAASAVYTVGLILLAVTLARERPPAWWAGVLLVATGPTSFFLTPVLPLVGLVWLVAGLALWRTDPRRA